MLAATDLIAPPQLMLIVGMMLLGWVMIRRQIGSRRRSAEQTQNLPAASSDADTPRSLPLSDAPLETQRWQVAMFDLQRDLKAELDTRIAVVQALLRQVDQRIADLESLKSKP